MDKPLVSVLTVTRNRGKLLKRCIASVLAQTYFNIEHIVVDGASDDNTDEVAASFQDERLRFIKLESNWPIKETIDYGVSLCRGKYITFLDSDDEYLPTKVEKQVTLIESLSNEYGFVYCWMTYYDNNTKKQLRTHQPQLRGSVGDLVVEFPLISGTPTLLFKSEVFRLLDGWKSPEEIGIASDWELCARACQEYKVDYVPESLVNVYVNHGSVRQSEGNKYYKDRDLKLLKFHSYFLTTFSDVFAKNPDKGWYHYESMVIYNFRVGNYSKSWLYFKKLLKIKPSVSRLVMFFKLLIK